MRILVVDDEAAIVRSVQRHLTRAGHQVRTALCGNDALVVLELFAADVVLTDFKMPGMNGIELLDIVAKQYPSVHRILMSGYADVGTPTDVAFLPKPYAADELRRVIEERARGAA